MKKKCVSYLAGILLISLSLVVPPISGATSVFVDFDPLVDVSVTVDIQTIRYLAIQDIQTFPKSAVSDTPNFYVNVFINDVKFTSPVYPAAKYIVDAEWNATMDVPDEQENVTITIELWSDETQDVPYDLSGDPTTDSITVVYSIKTGQWTGNDALNDVSGYGRVCGCDDGTIYEDAHDCELWFDITQNDYDGDAIPYWIEVNTLGTDPMIDDTTLDPDTDTIPTYWEYRWGYSPTVWNGHSTLDPDGDSIDNVEEFLTSQWNSDPFRKDVFVELDIMGDGPNGEKTYFPENSTQLLYIAFDKQNIVFHLDTGSMGGSDIIPFDSDVSGSDRDNIVQNYFLHGDAHNWRRGVFHYGLVVYDDPIAGFTFQPNAFQIASLKLEQRTKMPFLERDIVYASCYMHEMGHTFGFWQIPGHNRGSYYPWQIGWWLAHSYRSCMNYGWTYIIVDYSDGSRRIPDQNDWTRIDYAAFENDWGM